MKKRILLILTCMIFVIMLCASPLTCFAEEIVSEDTPLENVSDEDSDADGELPETEVVPDEPQPTLFSRVWEYCSTNKTEMLGLAGDAGIFALAIFVKLRNDKRTKLLLSDMKVVKGDTSGTVRSQDQVVGAVNTMIGGYDEMRTAYEKYESVEDDRNKLVGAVMVQNTAILEILATVYVNNKNLPQGVKDLIVLKYANCQKALGDEKLLLSIVESVREKIGTSTDALEESEVMEE